MPPPNSKVNLNKKKPDWFLYSYKFLHFFNFSYHFIDYFDWGILYN
jgi:hypothetical protein